MTYVEEIMHQMPRVFKPQVKFMLDLFAATQAFSGRATMANLSRYGAGSPQRLGYWSRKHFAFAAFNMALLDCSGVLTHRVCAAMDATFLKKSGKHTEGLGWFYNGSASRSEKGLEGICLALVDLDEHTAYAVDAEQTPAELPEGQSRVDFYLTLFKRHVEALKTCTQHLLVDGGFSSHDFVAGIREHDFHIIGKLRRDANLRYLFAGPHPKRRGARKKYDGKVDFENYSRFKAEPCDQEDTEIFSATVNHKSLKQTIKVVVIVCTSGGKRRHAVLFSTDLELSATEIIAMYGARFQIEFLFRDGKQFTGLGHAQVRDSRGLTFFMNSSLSTLNLMRLEDRKHAGETKGRVISIISWKRRKYNEMFAARICAMLGLELDMLKLKPGYAAACNFGVRAA